MKLNSLLIDIVNTASRIETSSEKQKVQISEMTKQLLNPDEWDIYERGIVQLKGKGLKIFELNEFEKIGKFINQIRIILLLMKFYS